MGVRDTLFGLGKAVAGMAGGALSDWAEKAERRETSSPESDPESDGNETAPGGSSEDTAENSPAPTDKATQDPKTLFWDPFAVIEQLGYKDKPSQISFSTLKLMIMRMPILYDIIQTRVNQVAAFSQVSHDRYTMGFRVRLKDKDQKPSKQDKKFIDQMETMILRTGITDNPRGRDSFEGFLRKVTYDSLRFDQMAFEVVPNMRDEPAEFYAVDATTIRLADSARQFIDEDLNKQVRYVQIYDGMIISEYNQEELCFGIRNPNTDIKLSGYGTSELEMLITAITNLLYSWEYNGKFFSQGSAAKGLLNFKGAINEKSLKAFRRHWYQMLSGVENAWKTPITNAEEVQWISLQTSNRDMEFNAWMDFLIKVCCAGYAMDPVEVNFKYGNTGQKGGMNEASNKEKITESKERGLRPLLRFLARSLNQHIIAPVNEDFEFDFVGLDAKTQTDVADLNMKRVKSYRTVDELRAEDDLPPLPDGAGEVILDPTFLAAKNAKAMTDQGLPPGGMPGAGGPPGSGKPGDDGSGVDFESLLADKDGAQPTGKPQFGQQADDDDDDDEGDDKKKPPFQKSIVFDVTV